MAPRSTSLRIVLVIGLIGLMGWFVFPNFGLVSLARMPTASMAPTIMPNSMVTVERMSYWFRGPERGEIVVFKTGGIQGLPGGQFLAKRVIGTPGDILVLSNGFVFVKDQLLTFTNDLGPIRFPLPASPPANVITNLTVPAGMYFVVGDNASNSYDSRFFGPLPRGNIVGRVLP